MSDELPSLADYLDRAVREFCAEFGGGIATGFACVVERIDSNGKENLTIATPDHQTTWKSLGLSGYLHEWFKDDAHEEMATIWSLPKPDEGDE